MVFNQAGARKRFVVMQIGHAGHRGCLPDNRSEDMAGGSPAVDRDIIVGRVDSSGDLPVTPEIYVPRRTVGGLNSVEKEVGRLVGRIEHAPASDIDVSGEIDRRANAISQNDL